MKHDDIEALSDICEELCRYLGALLDELDEDLDEQSVAEAFSSDEKKSELVALLDDAEETLSEWRETNRRVGRAAKKWLDRVRELADEEND